MTGPRTLQSLKRSEDFMRTLKSFPCAKTEHFALHHCVGRPLKLGTAPTDATNAPQDPTKMDAVEAPALQAHERWLGRVVPKRHAKRSVTRSLIKRHMSACAQNVAECLPPGIWVLRLRSAYSLKTFPSAASQALAHAVHEELDLLMQRALARSVPKA